MQEVQANCGDCVQEDSIKVEVSAFDLWVTVPNYKLLAIRLAFGITENSSECVLMKDKNILLIRLAHCPLEELLEKVGAPDINCCV